MFLAIVLGMIIWNQNNEFGKTAFLGFKGDLTFVVMDDAIGSPAMFPDLTFILF